MKNLILVLFVGLFGFGSKAYAQIPTNPAPEAWENSGVSPNSESLVAAFEILGFEAPLMGTSDWVAAVDADDASVILGFARVGINFVGEFVGAVSVNEPPGASNSFHLVLYDASAPPMFHVLNDANDEALVIEWINNDVETFVDGFGIEANGVFPGVGLPLMPGEDDFDGIVALLPVELTAFAGTFSNKVVNLNWSTASEEGNDFFAVERSANGTDFTEVGRITGMNVAANYSFVDENPVSGVNYYRLRQQDFDGDFAYSDVIQVTASGLGNVAAGVFPNPATTTFNLRLQGDWNEDVTITLLDQVGRVLRIYQQDRSALNELALPTLAAGIYQVRAEDGERMTTTKLVVNQ